MAFKLDAKIPAGALAEKWSNHKAAIKVVSPANKRKLDIIIVGTGLLSFNNVIMTSHQGFFTREALDSIAHTTLQNINDFDKHRKLVNEVRAEPEKAIG